MQNLILGVVCFCLFGLPAWADEAKPAKTDPVAQTRAKYTKLSAAVLKIVEPIKVTDAFYWKDGGSIGILLIDAKGVKHSFCLDGRSLPSKDDPNDKSAGTRNLFMGATHPADGAAKMVPAHGPEESALYGVMLRWANQHPNRDALYDAKINVNDKKYGNLWEIRAFFLRLDARFVRE